MRRTCSTASLARAAALLVTLVLTARVVATTEDQPTVAGAQSAPQATVDRGTTAPGSLATSGAAQDAGYVVAPGAIGEFFTRRGGVRTFGPPVSASFTLSGRTVQLFRNFALSQAADGVVAPLDLLVVGAVPGLRADGRTYPTVDPPLAQAAPATGAPDYATQAQTFIRLHAPDSWEGQPVGFYRTFLSSVTLEEAFPDGVGSPALLPVLAADLWGLPTGGPARDPGDRGLVHLRWEHGLMTYNQRSGQVEIAPLGAYFAGLLTGQGLPPDLAADAQSSPYYRQVDPSAPNGVARPAELPDTVLQGAFLPSAPPGALRPADTRVGPPQAGSAPLGGPAATATAPPGPDSCHGDEQITVAPDKPRIGIEVLIAVSSAGRYAYPRLVGTEKTTFVRERTGQLGWVYEWSLSPTQIGRHEYVFYIDSTIPCKKITVEVRGPLTTATPTNANSNSSSDDQPDLSLSVSDSPDPGTVGKPVTYAISVTNTGSSSAGGAKLTFAVSGSNPTIKSTSTTAGSCSQSGTAVNCKFGKLSAGGLAVVTVVVTPDAEGTLVATGSVSSDDKDASSGNNSASQSTDIRK